MLAPIAKEGFSVALNYEGKLEFPVVRYNLNTNLSTLTILEKPHSYIIHLNASNLKEDMVNLVKSKSYNSKANFIFVQEFPVDNLPSVIKHNYLVNVLTIDKKTGDINKYVSDRIENIGTCFKENLQFSYSKNLNLTSGSIYKVGFFNISPLQMCHPLSSRCKRKGINIEIIELAFESLNLSVEFVERIYSKVNEDDLFRNSPCPMNIFRVPSTAYDFTEMILLDPSIWVIRQPIEKPRWNLAFSIYNKEIWIYWFGSTLLISFTWFIVVYVLEKRFEFTMMLMVIGLVMIFFFDQSRRLSGRHFSHSLLICIIVVSTFLMNMFYKAKFAYLLTGVEYYPPVSSLNEMVDANMKFSFPPNFMSVFTHDSNIKYLKTHHDTCYNLNNGCYKKVSNDPNLAIISYDSKFMYEFRKFLDQNKKPLLYKLEEPIVTNYFTLLVVKGYPLTPYLNAKIKALREHGFIVFIKHHRYKSRCKENSEVVRMEKLNLDSVKFPFRIWFFGNLFGIGIFLKEYFYHRLYIH